MENDFLNNFLIKDDGFENLDSLKGFCEKFGGIKTLRIDNTNVYNIVLNITTYEEVELQLLCSGALSEIIREQKAITEDFFDYRVYRMTKGDGKKYIRVSQVIDIKSDPNLSIEENLELSKHIKGSKRLVFNIEDMKKEPFVPKKRDLDDLIAF